MTAIDRLNSFLKDVRIEVRKVTWPSWEELRESTTVVIVTVAIISVFIAVVDRLVGGLVTRLLTLR
jgi:preprotein translocase subunit SecE